MIANQESHRISREFLTAGRAVFTVQPPAEFCKARNIPHHYTYRISQPSPDKPLFAQLLAGPSNETGFKYLGLVDASDGGVRVTAKSIFSKNSFPVKILDRVLRRLFAGEQDAIESAGWKIYHEGCCGRCGRTLTTPESVELGIGPECRKLMKGGK